MLWTIKTVFKDGTVKDELIKHVGSYTVKPKQDNIQSCSVSRFKYDIEQLYPPTIFTDNNGKKFVIPSWIEIHPEATIDDINWTKPKLKKEIEHNQGSMGTYKTTYDPNKKVYKCTCMGYWRSKGNCKHVKSLKEKNNITSK